MSVTQTTEIVCDAALFGKPRCGASTVEAGPPNSARMLAHTNGWRTIHCRGRFDLCPECMKNWDGRRPIAAKKESPKP